MSVVPQSLPKWCRAANAALCHLRPSLRRKKQRTFSRLRRTTLWHSVWVGSAHLNPLPSVVWLRYGSQPLVALRLGLLRQPLYAVARHTAWLSLLKNLSGLGIALAM